MFLYDLDVRLNCPTFFSHPHNMSKYAHYNLLLTPQSTVTKNNDDGHLREDARTIGPCHALKRRTPPAILLCEEPILNSTELHRSPTFLVIIAPRPARAASAASAPRGDHDGDDLSRCQNQVAISLFTRRHRHRNGISPVKNTERRVCEEGAH